MLKRNLTGIFLLGCIVITPFIIHLFISNWMVSLILTMTVVPSYLIAYTFVTFLLYVLRIGQGIRRYFTNHRTLKDPVIDSKEPPIDSKVIEPRLVFGFDGIKFQAKESLQYNK
jgi:hypothetical protein